MSKDSTTQSIGKREVPIPNPDKAMFPQGFDKSDLIDYHDKAAEHMLPYLKERAVSLRRFPEGIGEKGFFNKRAAQHYPDWVRSEELPSQQGSLPYVVIDEKATLAYLVGQAAIEIHAMLCRVDNADRPDRLIFDLDPGEESKFDSVIEAALWLKECLDQSDTPSFPMLSGSRGIHVWTPLKRTAEFDEVREAAKRVAQHLVDERSDELTIETQKDQRRGRIFIDYLRNAYAQTSVVPYGVRARESAPVAVPVTWDELSEGRIQRPDQYTIKSVFRRLSSQKSDPWEKMQSASMDARSFVSAWS